MATNLLLLDGEIFEGSVVDEQKDMSLFFRRDESPSCTAVRQVNLFRKKKYMSFLEFLFLNN